ncbi:MAG: C40 family peptidase [Fibrobacter sp.]|nr:C40 family peptidase [Fibrobacter sp.]
MTAASKNIRPIPVLFLLVLMYLICGCTPSVRYVRDSSSAKKTEYEPAIQQNSLNTINKNHITDEQLLKAVSSYIGTPYKYGGMDRRGLDCSGFVCCVFRDVLDVKLPHNSFELYKMGTSVSVRRAIQGDLVFFRGRRRIIDHVGIYLGDGKFVHASTNRGVIYSELSQDYYKSHFAGIRRIFKFNSDSSYR